MHTYEHDCGSDKWNNTKKEINDLKQNIKEKRFKLSMFQSQTIGDVVLVKDDHGSLVV